MSESIETEVVPPTQALAVRQEGASLPSDIKPPITAAQAKVEAVAALTMSAYEKAATLELTPEETAALQADFPDDAFQPGAGGKEHLIYVEHAHLRDRFNQVFGMGKWAIVPRNRWAEPFKTSKGDEGSRIYVEAMLVVRGCFVGEAVGAMEYYPKNAAQNYGDAVEGAKTAAFRRCAKEFGVGLQAWKKEFCEGWWIRRRNGHKPPVAAPGRAAAPAPPSTPAPAAKAPVAPPKAATPATRAWMIKELNASEGQPNRKTVTEFFQKTDPPGLMPMEVLEDLPLGFVPAFRKDLNALAACITGFGNGEPAHLPYPVDPVPAAPAPPAPQPPAAKTPKDDEAWRDVIVPVPHKGENRDSYLKHPDTIGSLYDLRHGSDDESAAARSRLWGFVHHFEAKGWTKNDGTEMPPSDAEVKFREALDQFADWFERNHPDEKL